MIIVTFFQYHLSCSPLQVVYKFNSYVAFSTPYVIVNIKYQKFQVEQTHKNPTIHPQFQDPKNKQNVFHSICLLISRKVERYGILTMTNIENYFDFFGLRKGDCRDQAISDTKCYFKFSIVVSATLL